jgi:hypothetical protein
MTKEEAKLEISMKKAAVLQADFLPGLSFNAGQWMTFSRLHGVIPNIYFYISTTMRT